MEKLSTPFEVTNFLESEPSSSEIETAYEETKELRDEAWMDVVRSTPTIPTEVALCVGGIPIIMYFIIFMLEPDKNLKMFLVSFIPLIFLYVLIIVACSSFYSLKKKLASYVNLRMAATILKKRGENGTNKKGTARTSKVQKSNAKSDEVSPGSYEKLKLNLNEDKKSSGNGLTGIYGSL